MRNLIICENTKMKNRILKLLYMEGYLNEYNVKIIESGLRRIENILIDFGLVIFISCILKNIFAGIGMQFMHLLLRCHTGGYHASDEKRCQYLSWVSLIICLIFINCVDMQKTISNLQTVICIIYVIINSPIESINKPLTRTERKVFRKRSLLIVICISLCYVIFYINNMYIWNKVIGIVLLEITVSMVAAKYMMNHIKKI